MLRECLALGEAHCKVVSLEYQGTVGHGGRVGEDTVVWHMGWLERSVIRIESDN
jgi:hypothetical protein